MSAAEAKRSIVVPNQQGVHLKPSMMIVKLAQSFASEVSIENPEASTVAGAHLITEVMMLEAPQGTELVVTAMGSDAEAAVEAMVNLIKSGFGEP